MKINFLLSTSVLILLLIGTLKGESLINSKGKCVIVPSSNSTNPKNWFTSIGDCFKYFRSNEIDIGNIFISQDQVDIYSPQSFTASGTFDISPLDPTSRSTFNIMSGSSFLNITSGNYPLILSFKNVNIVTSYLSTTAILVNGTVSSYLMFNSCKITGFSGEQGSAIYSNGFQIVIENSEISDCASRLSGGSIFSDNLVTVINSTFSNSTSNAHGGSIFAPQIASTSCLFRACTAMNGGAIAGDLIYILMSAFVDNVAAGSGGAIYFNGAYSFVSGNIYTTTFSFNQASLGGAIFSVNFNMTLLNSLFYRNTAVNGGALYVDGSSSNAIYNISKTIFQYNSATGIGGSVYSKNIINFYGGEFEYSNSSTNGIQSFPPSYLGLNNVNVNDKLACPSNPAVFDDGFTHFLCLNVIGTCPIGQGIAKVSLTGSVYKCVCLPGWYGQECSLYSGSSSNSDSQSSYSDDSYSYENSYSYDSNSYSYSYDSSNSDGGSGSSSSSSSNEPFSTTSQSGTTFIPTPIPTHNFGSESSSDSPTTVENTPTTPISKIYSNLPLNYNPIYLIIILSIMVVLLSANRFIFRNILPNQN